MLVIEKKVFDRLQTDDQLIVREVMERVYQGFDEQGNEDNIQAFQALLDDGIKAVNPDQGQVQAWHDAIQKSNHQLAEEGVLSLALLNEIECYVSAYREGNHSTTCSQ